jgi:2',3'-cyclic-nucleotide 2'-phosphodiesterase (5'-nucleotidase family)
MMRAGTGIALLLVASFALGSAQAPPSTPPAAPAPALPEAPWKPDVRLVYESDTRAYYRPCGCNQNSAGGLSRRAKLLGDLRGKPEPVVLCSAGDFYGTADVFNEAKSRFVARMMGLCEYDAIGVGEMDLNFGLSTLVADVRSFKLPVVCANLVTEKDSLRVDSDGAAGAAAARRKLAFPPYRVVTRAGTRYGFVGLLSPSTQLQPMDKAHAPVAKVDYTLSDPLEAAQTVIPEVRAACDILIVLAHMSDTEASQLVERVPGIDLVVLGHDPQGHPIGVPTKVGGAYVVRATSQGQNIGELCMRLDDRRHVAEVFNRMHHMDASYPDDPAMTARIEGFDAENAKIQKELFARQQLSSDTNDPYAGRYLGLGACQSCHVEEFEVYMGTRHAHAYATLSSQFVHRDTNCVGCHVTGFGEAGGFSGVRMRGASVDLIDVQCEACHGPGRDHARDGSYRETAIQSCVRCHTPNDDPDFDFATDWPKIAH